MLPANSTGRLAPAGIAGSLLRGLTLPLLIGSLFWTTSVLAASSELVPCTVVDSSTNEIYDLRPFMKTSGPDYEVKGEDDKTFKLNVCTGVNTELWRIPDSDHVGIYRETDRGGESLGSYNTSPKLRQGNVVLEYEDGSICPATSALRMSSVIAFVCDPSISSLGLPAYVSSTAKGCSHFFIWRTSFACPKTIVRGPWGAIWTLATILLLTTVAYFTISVVYNRVVLGKRGMDVFTLRQSDGLTPRFISESSIGGAIAGSFDFVKTMAVIVVMSTVNFISSSVQNLRRPRQPHHFPTSSSPYSPLNVDADEESGVGSREAQSPDFASYNDMARRRDEVETQPTQGGGDAMDGPGITGSGKNQVGEGVFFKVDDEE